MTIVPGLNPAWCEECGEPAALVVDRGDNVDDENWQHAEPPPERYGNHPVRGPWFECAFETHPATRIDQAAHCENEATEDVDGTLYCPQHATTTRAMIADDDQWHDFTEEDQ